MFRSLTAGLTERFIALVCLSCSIQSSEARIVLEDDTEKPQAITIVFASGNVTFRLNKDTVERIDFQVKDKQYTATFVGCQPLRQIRFETSQFFNGAPDRVKVGSFTLTFRMGAEDLRTYGELPLIEVSIRDGKTASRTITRLMGQHSYYGSPLCQNEGTPGVGKSTDHSARPID